jgi:hypothetical protein
MKLFLVVVVLGIGAILGAYVFGWGKYTNCYADFQTAEAAERVASVARATHRQEKSRGRADSLQPPARDPAPQ